MFQGVFSALITPFLDGRIDEAALKRLIDYQIDGGVDGIVPCGTTGESATLSVEEHVHAVEACVRLVAGRVQVVAGCGSNATAEAIVLTRAAKQAGAQGALLITPYYNKPTQAGLLAHYQAVAEAVDLPIIPYNVPGRTGVDIKPETMVALSRVPGIAGLKEATANMELASLLHNRCGASFSLLSGDDATFLPFLVCGGHGVISVTANIAPRQMAELWRCFRQGDLAGAQRLHWQLLEINQVLFCETNPIPVKAAAHMMGLCGPEIRLPLTPLAEGMRPALRGAMERLGMSFAP